MSIVQRKIDPEYIDDDILEDASLKPNAEFITGSAGTGKTTYIKQEIEQNPSYGILCATTGIAAVNLAGKEGSVPITTINSLLGYFDTDSLAERYARGKLNSKLHRLAGKYRNIVIDEVSMLDARQLDIIHSAVSEVNRYKTVQNKGGLGLVLTGDFVQLPPVSGDYCFKALCWDQFSANVTRLQKVWRQTNPDFLDAINAARRGDGDRAAELLRSIEQVSFSGSLNTNFDGTTIFSKNADVDRLNGLRLNSLIYSGAKDFTIRNYRWGVQRKEWSLIPEQTHLAIGAYVMILSNDIPEFRYANGSCGKIVDVEEDLGSVSIQLAKDSREVDIGKIIRQNTSNETPDGYEVPDYLTLAEFKLQFGAGATKATYREKLTEKTKIVRDNRRTPEEPYFDFVEERWVLGELCYIPLRLAYAATVHRTQGLTLDKVQIDIGNAFFGYPSMLYVAISRVKTPEGLHIVGNPRMLANRCNVMEDVLPWI